ncbi:MAG TPA: c-type cytochrome [Planctomycetota bacterium]|nr:c-type cytochrome [Planctomycetota bacterium]
MNTPPPAPSDRSGRIPLPVGVAVLALTLGGLVTLSALGLGLSRAPRATVVRASASAMPGAPGADAAADDGAAQEAALRARIADAACVAIGKGVFAGKCAACHTAGGGGMPGLGPNLTDDHWVHGSDMTDLVRTITNGSPTNPLMVAWKSQLTADEITAVAAYIVTLKGTVQGGRAPDGKLTPIAYWPATK